MACENCGRYWHLCCVGLGGLTEQMVGLLENWQCQDCYQCPNSYLDKSQSVPSSSECGTIQVMVRDELKAIQPVIRVTVENAVRNMRNNSVCSFLALRLPVGQQLRCCAARFARGAAALRQWARQRLASMFQRRC